ncbi:uncharacterized protein [Epargyreus clarus]|uniref:uncharacterized protein n=1 Tax=Epargyreus clarus TaxID=520877 RepID=UPI003C2CA68A
MVKDHVPCKSIVFIVSSSNHVDFSLRDINDFYCFSILTRSFAGRRWRVYPNAYIISANDSTDLLNGLLQLSEDLSWTPKAKFIILFNKRVNDMSEIFQELNNLLVFNVIILTNTENHELEAFTYYPHSGGYCGRNASVRSLGHCPKFSVPLFPNKVRKGFRNCTIIVSVREDLPYVMINNTDYVKYIQTGVEQYVLNTIAKYEGLDIQYNYVNPTEDIGLVLPNRTGTVGNRLEVFDYIYGYSFAMFCIFTPALHEEKWTRVYKQFSVLTWFLIILSFFVTILVFLSERNFKDTPFGFMNLDCFKDTSL